MVGLPIGRYAASLKGYACRQRLRPHPLAVEGAIRMFARNTTPVGANVRPGPDDDYLLTVELDMKVHNRITKEGGPTEADAS